MDQDDRLVQVSKGVYASGAVLENEFTVEYSYDSTGRMLRRDNGSEVTSFVWDGWDLLSEETDSVVTTYLVPDGLVWSFVRGEDVFQVHTDALGSVRVVTDSEGEVVARFESGAWGELLPGSFDSVGLALRFVGGLGVRTDLETGLYSMRHRWYDAELHRFISRDPVGVLGMQPMKASRIKPGKLDKQPKMIQFDWQLSPLKALGVPIPVVNSSNADGLYVYARNAPLNYTDPQSLFPVLPRPPKPKACDTGNCLDKWLSCQGCCEDLFCWPGEDDECQRCRDACDTCTLICVFGADICYWECWRPGGTSPRRFQ